MKVSLRFRTFLFAAFLCVPFFAGGQSANDVSLRRAQLEKELAALEVEIEGQRSILEQKQRESVSLERDIAIINAKIEKARLSIRARNLAIERISGEIRERQATIGTLSAKIGREKDSLGELIRKTNELDSYSLAEVVLSSRELSDFFADADSFSFIRRALFESSRELEETKSDVEDEKRVLEEKRQEEVDLRTIQELEKKRSEEQEAEKKRILKASRGIEGEYQKLIKSRQESAAKIRTELFTLQGSAAIPFEKALEFATRASAKTGIRPAFLLGIIAEESNLGANVGTGNWRVDMKAPRDTEPFVDITRRLGLDPDRMPVSKKAWYGYGGAMGPAQFIPSTWILYEDKIANATGHRPPNPWEPEDAFMAAALLLSESGAKKQTVASERYAALCYLAGCRNAGKKAYQFYADDVMELAEKYQRQMEILTGR